MFFEDNAKKVMIVHSSGREEQYVHDLFRCITQMESVETSQPITISEYQASFVTIDNIPKGKIIFFGNSKEIEMHGKAVNWKFDKFGMKYGWLGKRCVIAADSGAVKLKEQNAFAEYYNNRVEQFRNIMELNKVSFTKIGTANWQLDALSVFVPVMGLIRGRNNIARNILERGLAGVYKLSIRQLHKAL